MNSSTGIDCKGLDSSSETEERRKSALLLQARQLRAADEHGAAAEQFAFAAEIEERLSQVASERRLTDKPALHLFNAAGCWAQAGNLYRAILLCEDLLGGTTLPGRLHSRVLTFTETLRAHRAEWSAQLTRESAGSLNA